VSFMENIHVVSWCMYQEVNENSDHGGNACNRKTGKEESDALRRWLLHRCSNIPRLSLHILSYTKKAREINRSR
jgi:hypothetical protein